MTDLFVACAGVPSATLVDVIPPAVRRTIEDHASIRRDGDDVIVDAGAWIPRTPASHLLPSLALLSPSPCGVRFEVSIERQARWSPWVATVTLGEAGFRPLAASADGLRADIDEFHAEPAAHAVRLRARLRGCDHHVLSESPWLLTLSAWGGRLHLQEPMATTAVRPAALGVPSRSQMMEDERVRARICSPTSVAMVMDYLGHAVTTSTLAEEVFHPATDRYGVWPAAIKAAASHGLAGYLLRFPDWDAALWCLAHGLPIVASLRYQTGELTGAPMPRTTGHLVVITGVEEGEVLVNDPAASTPMEVPHRYRQDEFVRAWLGGSGVGYVFFRC
jgi:hypothetical protein